MDNREGFQAQGWNHATTGDQPRQRMPQASGLRPMPPLRPMPSPGMQPPPQPDASPARTYPTPAAGTYGASQTPVAPPKPTAPQPQPMYPAPAMGAYPLNREPAPAYAQPAQPGGQAGFAENRPQPTVTAPQGQPAPQPQPMYPTPSMGAYPSNYEPAPAYAQPAQPGGQAGFAENRPQPAVAAPQGQPVPKPQPMYPTPAMGAYPPNREPAPAYAQPAQPGGQVGFAENRPQPAVAAPQGQPAPQPQPIYPAPAMGAYAAPGETATANGLAVNLPRTERHIWTQTVAQQPPQPARPVRERPADTVPRAAFVPDVSRAQPEADAEPAGAKARRRRAERLDGVAETPEPDELFQPWDDVPEQKQPAAAFDERPQPSPVRANAPEPPAAWQSEPVAELLDDDSGRFEPVADVPLAEPVPVPTREAYRAKSARAKRRAWPAVLGTVAALAAIAAALLFTGLGKQLLSAAQPSRVGQAGVPSVFAQRTPQGGDTQTQTQALATIAPAQPTTAAELVSVAVDPASATAPATLTFKLETNSETSSIRLLTATGDVVRAVAYGTPKRDGLSWRLEATLDTPYTGKIRVFLRNQAGEWTEANQTCDVAVQ